MHWHFTDFKKSESFWDGFWSVFRHPLFVYGAGVVMGIFLCAVLK